MVEAAAFEATGDKPEPRRRGRGGRKPTSQPLDAAATLPVTAPQQIAALNEPAVPEDTLVNAAAKPSTRSRRPRKPALKPDPT